MANHTLVEFLHSNSFHNLMLTPTSRWMGLHPLQTSQVIQGLVAQDYHLSFFGLIVNLCLVQRFNMQRTSSQAPFLKLSLTSAYATHECYQTKSQTQSNTYIHNPICHEGHLTVVQTCASTRQIFPVEGPPKKVCHINQTRERGMYLVY